MADKTTEVMRAVMTLAEFYGKDGWVPLGAVREVAREYGMVSRNEFDEAVIRLAYMGAITTIPEENQKTITSAMDYNGVTLGWERKHYAQVA